MLSQFTRPALLCRRSYATAAEVVKPSCYGQPLFRSHPHLVQPNELTAGISAEEYELRRRRLMESLPDNSVVVSVAAPTKYMSGKIFYQYRQASDFWYLTGFEEPNAAVILEKTSASRGYRMTLFSTGNNPEKAKWDGATTSLSDATQIFKSDDALPISSFSSHLQSIVSESKKKASTSSYSYGSSNPNFYLDIPPSPSNLAAARRLKSGGEGRTSRTLLRHLSSALASEHENQKDETWNLYETVGLNDVTVKPLAPQVAKLRVIKSEAEQRLMRMAGDISGRAHAKTMRFACPGLSESTLAAHFEYLCKRDGAQRLAYVPVVASGPNGLIIHYTTNNHIIREDEMILVDAGCEYNGYASDITRTYPATGQFTPPQRELYLAVLSAQKALINLCTESAGMTMWELHRLSSDLMKGELRQLGFDFGDKPRSGSASRIFGGAGRGSSSGNDAMEVLYPHFLSHPIGIDLHESDNFDRSGKLKAGMVITIEPGLYVPPTSQFPKHYHNLAVRIEDEVLVGKEHPIILSVSAPKEIADVEGACQGLLGLEPF